jgi:hypothetical protein
MLIFPEGFRGNAELGTKWGYPTRVNRRDVFLPDASMMTTRLLLVLLVEAG